MISTDFAPNEDWDDAWLSLKILLKPWLWKNGHALIETRNMLKAMFSGYTPFLYLSARSALSGLLHVMSFSPGDEVIVQAFTCEAVILPIIENKLKPVYADIENKTFSMDPIALEGKITDRTKAVILQHTFGLTPLHRKKIQSIISRKNLLLIEDIAHGINDVKLKIKPSESEVKNSESIYLMSFGRSKAYSSVFGGAIMTDNERVIDLLKPALSALPMPSRWFIFRLLLYKPLAVLIKKTYDFYFGRILHKIINLSGVLIPEITQKEKRGEYDHVFDKAYPNALALLINHQLRKYDQMRENRALICDIYLKSIPAQNGHRIIDRHMIRYPLLVNNPDSIKQAAVKENIFLGSWYNQVVAPKSLNLSKLKYQAGSCPHAERICKQILNLPNNINGQEALKVINIVNGNTDNQ